MRYIITLLLIIGAIFIPSSCEDLNLFIDCSNCFPDIGAKYNLKISVSINAENQLVPITVYKGTIDNGEVISTDYTSESTYYSIPVKFGEYYSAEARYRDKGRVIYAVDGRKLIKSYHKSGCDEACYEINGEKLDLRLK